ncbi:hypothetical protein GALMADRAFT_229128 [Galerina marginata CBS 339.88]|uniref:Uncharacterized protein n=1 Tax=Galerina marginata (strain CBS 339.88) TaxID=685588 RepID=A0A067SZY2_GALM3|nr:hypothetical protein GALMADRAFT_229128 [Galerina marginata CBS 339.88]
MSGIPLEHGYSDHPPTMQPIRRRCRCLPPSLASSTSPRRPSPPNLAPLFLPSSQAPSQTEFAMSTPNRTQHIRLRMMIYRHAVVERGKKGATSMEVGIRPMLWRATGGGSMSSSWFWFCGI